MNIKVNKLRKFKYRTPEKFDLKEIKRQIDERKGNIGLKELREHREQTIARWRRVGLLEGLSGNINENSAKLFEGALSYKFP
jgi:hypothetical protein